MQLSFNSLFLINEMATDLVLNDVVTPILSQALWLRIFSFISVLDCKIDPLSTSPFSSRETQLELS